MDEKFLSNYLNVNNPLDDPNIIHKLSVVTTHYVFRNICMQMENYQIML